MSKKIFNSICILILLVFSIIACGDNPTPAKVPENTISLGGSKPEASPTVSKPEASPTVSKPEASPTVSKPEASPTVSITNDEWLKGIPCRAPCWENITPGKTSPDEAQNLLKSIPKIKNITVEDPKYKDKPVAIYWYQDNQNKSSGFLSYHSQPTPVSIEIIKPSVPPFNLKDVQTLYGEPTNIIVVDITNELGLPTGQYKTYLIYINIGLIVSTTNITDENIAPEMVFSEVYFFTPGMTGFNNLDAQDDLKGELMVNWEGFNDLKYYCRYKVVSGIHKC